jgi:hypothetical protein
VGGCDSQQSELVVFFSCFFFAWGVFWGEWKSVCVGRKRGREGGGIDILFCVDVEAGGMEMGIFLARLFERREEWS